MTLNQDRLPRRILLGIALVIVVVAIIVVSRHSPKSSSEPDAALATPSRERIDFSCCHTPESEVRFPETANDKVMRLKNVKERSSQFSHPFLSSGGLESTRKLLEAARKAGNPRLIFGGRLAVARQLVGVGELSEAISELEGALAEIDANPGAFQPSDRTEALYSLGLAWFRHAERQNCIAHHNESSCIFPLNSDAVHVDPTGARHALTYLERVLKESPEYSEARWLMNIAQMALGTWPDGVPKDFRYVPARFASEEPMPRFVDVAAKLGVNRRTRAGSVVMDDFDGDGLLDLVSSSFDPSLNLRFYRNLGDGSFKDITEEAGLGGQLGGINLVQADFDNDGKLDLLVLRGGGLHSDGEMPLSLLRQTGPGVFIDVTREAGIDVEGPTRTAAFADIDLDGDLDLFVGYEAEPAQGGGVRFPNRLYLNDGQGHFQDILASSGIDPGVAVVAAAFGDLDGDRLPDLYCSIRYSPNRLYKNLGGGKFEDVTQVAKVERPDFSSVAWIVDFDNDGDLDIFVGFQGHDEVQSRAIADYYWNGTVRDDMVPRLYENLGGFHFRDCTEERGLFRPLPMLGGTVADIDNDGFPDFYLGTGSEHMDSLWPNVMLRNAGGKRFRDVSESCGLGHLQKSEGMAVGDLDQDGDVDLFVQMGGFSLDDAFTDSLFRNPGHGNHWISVTLAGVKSNRSALGARIRVRVLENGSTRDIYGFVGPKSSFGGSSLRQIIGLGQAEKIVDVEIVWPSGLSHSVKNVVMDRAWRIVEGADQPEEMNYPRCELGQVRRAK